MEPEPQPETQTIFIPPDFYCPITGELLRDPVSEPSGHTYERTEILKWLQTSKSSPITREYIDESNLTDNLAMKRSIESIKDKLTEDQLRIDSMISEQSTPIIFKGAQGDITINQYYHNDKLFVNIDTPNVDQRPPIDLVLCIDVSASMSAEATLKGSSNETIRHGISVLSLTVTAAKTILSSLNETDNISIVTYSSAARTLVKNVSCTPENKLLINMELDSLKVISNTNMWVGMVESLDILRATSVPTKNKGIILLTDGVPNVVPPRGHEIMLERYFDQHNFRCMFSCYGFGYSLESDLLLSISSISGGDGYSFIPDASILGSVFINGLANILTTAVYKPTVTIQLSKGARFKTTGQEYLEISVDSLKYGRSKNLIFDIDTSCCSGISGNKFSEVTLILPDGKNITNGEITKPRLNYMREQLLRYKIIDIINDCITLRRFNDMSYKDTIISLISTIKGSGEITDYIGNFLFDLEGQVKEALNMTSQGEKEDWFTKWGIHYLRSLQEAYSKEICNNFKDKGVSNFKGPIFESISDQISDIFDTIPPPKPDIQPSPHTRRGGGVCRGGASAPSPAPLRSMSVYNNAGGGCCTGDSKVLMGNGQYINASSVKKGDRVITHEFNENNSKISIDTIECVVKTIIDDSNLTDLVVLDNLKITPFHPIVNFKKWTFPSDIKAPEKVTCNALYTFVTKNRNSIVVEGYTYCTLGHKITGEVIEHDFFGSDNVINDLKKINTYDSGIVELTPEMFIRNENNIVNEIKFV
jgi:hypothetical protein